jgi:thiol-disulfide isomerase/thioredoxin
MRVLVFAIVAALTAAGSAPGGEFNEVLSVGDKAPAWKELPDAVTGKPHSMADLTDSQVVVVVFTCNSCPYATDYEDRIIRLAEKYRLSTGKGEAKPSPNKRVSVVAINVNKVKADLPPAMKARAQKKHYPFPYLFDESQQIAKDYGALFTPQFFVLDGDRRVVYMGAFDDNSDATKVNKQYVEPAIEAALGGKAPETKETLPVGCRIRFPLRRR